MAVAARGERGIVLAIAQDRRADEYHQIGLGAAAAARFEQLADQRNIAEQRDALDRPAFVVVEQSAAREHLPIVDGQHRLERADRKSGEEGKSEYVRVDLGG